MKRLRILMFGLLGALLPILVLLYLAGIANLGMGGFPRAIKELTPIIVIVGLSVGIAARKMRASGCITSGIAGLSTVLAALVTALATDTSHPGFVIPIHAYLIGICIGLVCGIGILIGVAMVDRWYHQ